MPAVDFTESVVEKAALQWFAEIGYDIGHGPDLVSRSHQPRVSFDAGQRHRD
jgi:hypothetical protein